ncbi:glycosyltransferase family A protein [Arthrobacter caoxuetaonis]|uniref:Glycosyltransferase family 2 protein n=1 Tax=Arthrobacter caoxuetaonis TaxID=2886935 RepID=A0A9X1SCR8_9MICC|nr:glycosyltransferase family A protein [Arthrobacter caoxuetaonis]MCC3298915.1 glycosyltransferase family 2 protein [Arthrobacter caoxuetaonis]USQ58739.1 glycosyltransferase family 2 protein [Arthrobacter caoxuetaonis]
MATITVVIPSRNDAPFLARCLEALSHQTRPPDETLVVDNGSTDNTAAVCEAAGVRRITEDVPGIAAATACGFDAASGDVLARLDADSVPPADWLERMEILLGATGELTAVTGPGDFYGGNRLTRWIAEHMYIAGYRWSMNLLLGHPPLFGSNFAMRASMWKRLSESVKRSDERIHDDLDISYHVAPDMDVVWDDSLRVGVSARPLESWKGLGRRLSMAWHTFRAEFAEEAPLKRLRTRRQRAAANDGAAAPETD